MPAISEQVTIPSPPDIVWPLLADPALVASCIPGASLQPSQVAGVYEGTMRVRLGPTVAIFRGEARLAYDHEARRCRVEARGSDGRGQSRAIASGVVTADGAEETQLSVEGSFTVTGPLEAVANAGGIPVARALLAEFARNIAMLLSDDEGALAPDAEDIPIVEPQTVARQARAAAVQTAPAVAGAAERRGEASPWRALLSSLRQLFSR